MEDQRRFERFMTSLADVLSSHSQHIRRNDEENKALTEMIETLDNENKALYGTVKRLVVKNEKLSATVDRLAEENKFLSWKGKVHDRQIAKMQAENKELSVLMELKTTEIENLCNNVSQLQTKASKDANSSRYDYSVLEDIVTYTDISKRIVLHSDTDILRLVTTHGSAIQKLQKDISALKSDLPKGGAGSTYVRWGSNNCSGNGTELVYSGFSAGSDAQNSGSAANYICLSPDPLWGHYSDAHNADATVVGVEYQFSGVGGSHGTSAYFHKNVYDEDAPCSVCRSRRSTVIMIPGRNQCYKGWNLEYKGYLVAGYYGHAAASEYVCLDDHPDVIPGGHNNNNGKLFYLAEGRCGSLTCPPYVDGRELTCVVCSK